MPQTIGTISLQSFALVTEPSTSPRTSRALAREQGAEGRLWPVVLALGLSALAVSATGWFLLPRSSPVDTAVDRAGQPPAASLLAENLDQRQQLLGRLRALQVDRGWFLQLVDASQLSSESLEDGPLPRLWIELAEQWLVRIEQLPPAIRARLGRLNDEDWDPSRQALQQQGVHPNVMEHLVSAVALHVLPGAMQDRKPAEPFQQLWIAAAMVGLDKVEIKGLRACPLEPFNRSIRLPAAGVRLVMLQVPASDGLTLGITGTPLMQMMVFDANGRVVQERGPLPRVWPAGQADAFLQVIVTNQGVSPGVFTVSCRAAPPDQ